jgi:hypothetical protein
MEMLPVASKQALSLVVLNPGPKRRWHLLFR